MALHNLSRCTLVMPEIGSGIVHAIWNVVIIGGGLAIGEKMDKYSIMTYVLNSKDFAITGGEFGRMLIDAGITDINRAFE